MTNTPSSSWMLNATGLDSNTSHNQLSRIPSLSQQHYDMHRTFISMVGCC